MKEHFKTTAALVGDPIRATILWTLLDGRAFTATELAIAADTSASNISMHLAKMVDAGLLKVEVQGRHRYYTYSRRDIAQAVETLGALIPFTAKRTTSFHAIDPAIQQCRTCYDHLAGKTGVNITDTLLKNKYLTADKHGFNLTRKGVKLFSGMGIDLESLHEQRRSFLRPCLDWSERRYHMAGSLPAALLDMMLEQDWVRRTKNSRVVIVTGKGQKKLYEVMEVTI